MRVAVSVRTYQDNCKKPSSAIALPILSSYRKLSMRVILQLLSRNRRRSWTSCELAQRWPDEDMENTLQCHEANSGCWFPLSLRSSDKPDSRYLARRRRMVLIIIGGFWSDTLLVGCSYLYSVSKAYLPLISE